MPFTVITLKKSTPSLRGDLTKWMQEIATGVYIGNFNARIRDKLWKRVTETVGDGEATMSFAHRNEIGYQFVTWNTERQNIDYEGIPLVAIPVLKKTSEEQVEGFSDASRFRRAKQFSSKQPANKVLVKPYIVIDVETTGFDENKDEIIELAAIRIDGDVKKEYHQLISIDKKLPCDIVALTGITDTVLSDSGVSVRSAIDGLLDFIGGDLLVGYNIKFDMKFINSALDRLNYPTIGNRYVDLMYYVKKEKMFLLNYKLESVLKAYDINEEVPHRALQDAELISRLSFKVNKFRDTLRNKC